MADFDFETFRNSIDGLPPSRQLELAIETHEALLGEKIFIENQISEAKARRWANGKHADPNWFQRAQAAVRIKKMQIQQLQNLRGEIGRKQKQLKRIYREEVEGPTFERHFLKVAKKVLDKAVFDYLVRITRTELEELEEGIDDPASH
jgi:hypothetical protein